MNLLKVSPTKLFLLLILFAAFLLRVNNLAVGFPILYLSNDEAVYHLSALNMLAEKTPFSLGNYGPLGSYIQIPFLILAYVVLFITGRVDSVGGMERLLVSQDGYLLLIPRVLSALFGTLLILSIFRLAIVLSKNKSVALWGSFFTAVAFCFVHTSHLARSFSPALLFITLSILFSIHALRDSKQKFKNSTLAFIFSAIAFGFHQIAGIVVLFPLITSLQLPIWKNFQRNMFVYLSIWIFMVFVFNYLSLGENFTQVFKADNDLGLALIRTPEFWFAKTPQEIISTIFLNIKALGGLVYTDGLLLMLAVWGFVTFKMERRLKIAITALFLINLILFIFVFPPLLRYFLPATVILPVFAGFCAHKILSHQSKILVVGAILVASFSSLYWNLLILHEPTFVQMRKWLDLNVPSQTPIAATFYRSVGYVPSSAASGIISGIRPNYYERAANLIGDEYPYNVRNVLYLESFEKESKEDNLGAGLKIFPIEYVIDVYYMQSERLLSKNNNLELIAHFSPTGNVIFEKRIPEAFADVTNNIPFFILERPGAYIDVLKIVKI